ncbi:hypothetical protein Avbf_10532 [Armadillidium vulgare]|nr:hypothetical protein Avbf_10532 [Armadillidium vulgare]
MPLPVVSYDSDRGGVSVVTEKGPVTSTNLLVRRAGMEDSGTYTCNPSSAPPAKVIVHILNVCLLASANCKGTKLNMSEKANREFDIRFHEAGSRANNSFQDSTIYANKY